MERSVIMVMADGARVDIFEDLLAHGSLPEISRHVVSRGSYRQASSVFASTTGPAHLPFLCGLFPGTANIPGIRWFDRKQMRFGQPLFGLRSYCGVESPKLDSDLITEGQTLYELAGGSNVFGCLTRGAEAGSYQKLKTPLWLYGHLKGDYRPADYYAGRAIAEFPVGERFRFVMFAGIDGHAHHYSPFDRRTISSYIALDRAVGQLANQLMRSGRYQSTLILIVSDHGHTPVKKHFDIGPELDRIGLRAAYHSGKAARFNPKAISCVSGNGMAHIYLPGRRGWVDWADPDKSARLAERLLAYPAVDLVAYRRDGGLVVTSSRGQAFIEERGEKISYRKEGADPLGLDLPEEMSREQALALTFDSDYPDGPQQLVQLLRSPRSGDLFVSARPGFDLRERYEGQEHRSGHGALHRNHMLVPIMASAPLAEGPMRTVDIYQTALDWLGLAAPATSEGVSRLTKR